MKGDKFVNYIAKKLNAKLEDSPSEGDLRCVIHNYACGSLGDFEDRAVVGLLAAGKEFSISVSGTEMVIVGKRA